MYIYIYIYVWKHAITFQQMTQRKFKHIFNRHQFSNILYWNVLQNKSYVISSHCVQSAICSLRGLLRLSTVSILLFASSQNTFKCFFHTCCRKVTRINNRIRHIRAHSSYQPCSYHEKTAYTSCDRAGSGMWWGVGLGFLDECFSSVVGLTGSRVMNGLREERCTS